jgi:hypothetical protein
VTTALTWLWKLLGWRGARPWAFLGAALVFSRMQAGWLRRIWILCAWNATA